MDQIYAPGTTSQMIEVTLRSSATGQLLTGKLHSDMTIKYQREGAATATTLSPVTATLGAWTSSGWKETQISGVYQFGIPNAALVAGAGSVTFVFTCTGAIDAKARIVFTPSANVTYLAGQSEPLDNLVLALGNASGVMISDAAVDAVWNEPISGHLTAGTMGAKLNTASSGSGSGSTAYTNTVTDDSSNPLDGVEVWITSDSGGASTVASTTTSTLGTFTVYLDPGTYYLWLAKGGYNFPNPTTITVT